MALLSKLSNKRSQGSIYEQKARVYLETQGLKFIAANQTFKCGELDLVMTDGDTIVFVEVRQRKSNRFGSAVESIDYRKQQKWLNAANIWLFTKRNQSLDTAKCRFDVVAFEGDNPPLWLPNFLG
ncbi:YraN family protein [Haemophilus parahaemolyticus]|uniref:YraN family protein n=1 Tax=Haemophilus parahaemolyticus TaxID=735 RepID=UPI0028D633A4|nr:YraN family protein [Haemophilus parahaemolyticus]MDU4465456.1 YraN family protein [Haemophilus parahaemolyticus]